MVNRPFGICNICSQEGKVESVEVMPLISSYRVVSFVFCINFSFFFVNSTLPFLSSSHYHSLWSIHFGSSSISASSILEFSSLFLSADRRTLSPCTDFIGQISRFLSYVPIVFFVNHIVHFVWFARKRPIPRYFPKSVFTEPSFFPVSKPHTLIQKKWNYHYSDWQNVCFFHHFPNDDCSHDHHDFSSYVCHFPRSRVVLELHHFEPTCHHWPKSFDTPWMPA